MKMKISEDNQEKMKYKYHKDGNRTLDLKLQFMNKLFKI